MKMYFPTHHVESLGSIEYGLDTLREIQIALETQIALKSSKKFLKVRLEFSYIYILTHIHLHIFIV